MRLSTETDRVEAFTDRVLAVILAIIVLGLRAPQGTEPRSLLATLPAFATFAVSFILIGIYWNNYHHMLRASRGVDGRGRGANLHLLFWLSLVPFVKPF
jgi:TMEM175 potassium channel family protein